MTPSRRHLRAQLGAATRYGHDAEAAALRLQLALIGLEDDIATRLTGVTLTGEQTSRLCTLLWEHTDVWDEPVIDPVAVKAQVAEYGEQLRLTLATGEPIDPAALIESL